MMCFPILTSGSFRMSPLPDTPWSPRNHDVKSQDESTQLAAWNWGVQCWRERFFYRSEENSHENGSKHVKSLGNDQVNEGNRHPFTSYFRLRFLSQDFDPSSEDKESFSQYLSDVEGQPVARAFTNLGCAWAKYMTDIWWVPKMGYPKMDGL